MKRGLTEILDRTQIYLVKEIGDVDQLFLLLQEHNVLSGWTIAECKSKSTTFNKVDAVIEALKRVKDEYYRTFCDVLIAMNREDLVKKYLQSGLSLLDGKRTSEPERSMESESGKELSAHSSHSPNKTPLPAVVFLSYQSSIRPQVLELFNMFMANDIKCWMDNQQMDGGQIICDKLDDAIRDCRVFLSLITKGYTESKYCKREMQLAFEFDKPIIPLRLDDIKWPPAGLVGFIVNPHVYIDFRPAKDGHINWQSKFDQLLGSVRNHLNGGPAENHPSRMKGQTRWNYVVAVIVAVGAAAVYWMLLRWM